MPHNALQSILAECALALSALRDVKTPQQGQDLLHKLGYEIPFAAFGSALAGLATNAGDLVGAASNLAKPKAEVDVAVAIIDMLARIDGTVAAIIQLQSQLKAQHGADVPDIEELPRRLTDFLILEYIARKHSRLHATLHVLGLIEYEPQPPPGTPVRLVNWDQFGQFFTDPRQILFAVYQWSNDNFEVAELFARLQQLLSAMMPPNFAPQPAMLGGPSPVYATQSVLRFPIFHKGVAPNQSEFGIDFALDASPGKPKGLALTPYLEPPTNKFDFNTCDHGEVRFQATGKIQDMGVVIRPPATVEAPKMSGPFRAAIDIYEKSVLNEEMILIGSPGGTRLALQGLVITWFVEQDQGKVDLGVEAGIKALRLVIAGGEGDGFLQKILSSLHVEAEAALALGMTLRKGFIVGGGAKLALELPVHLEIGPLKIESLRLALALADKKTDLEVGVLFKFDFGPLQALIENIGMRIDLHLRQGNLGPLDLDVGFKPPNGVGLSIDAGVIKGGGYLYFDFEREEYAGALELVFSGTITLKAIGLITTRMPDGSKGFSLLIIITAEFGTGIQLGYGFTLLAVGGLLGLNRAMDTNALMGGVTTGAINSIMFPENVVENAPRIISDLRTFFPPQEGKFLIGPMAKIGWGTPPLISVALGIIIEIPGNVAILGVLKAALPNAEAPLLVLQVNFLGVIDFDKKRLAFKAALFDSRLLFITLEGEMGLLLAFGDDANFVLSVGGFHSRYKPPSDASLPKKRLTCTIINESWARILVRTYFAVTSNSVQFGAKAELALGWDEFGIDGHIEFDALFQFSPFFFSASGSSGVSLHVFGFDVLSISLSFTLEGPTPWRIRGRASITILVEITVKFDETWGKKHATREKSIDVMALLQAEFDKPENWQALLPPGSSLLVSLRKLEVEENILVLHPVGTLRVSQRAVPLDLTIDKVGSRPVSDGKRFTVSVTSEGLAKTGDVNESFAPAQFQDLSDAARLTRPAFEPQHGGIELSGQGAQLASSKLVQRVLCYEQHIIDTNFERFVRPFRPFNRLLFAHFLKGASASRSALSQAHRRQLQPFAEKIKVQPDNYAVALNHDNTAYRGTASVFASEAMAREFMHRQIAADANLAETLHVIPAFELNG